MFAGIFFVLRIVKEPQKSQKLEPVKMKYRTVPNPTGIEKCCFLWRVKNNKTQIKTIDMRTLTSSIHGHIVWR